jgi:hypothetical protein
VGLGETVGRGEIKLVPEAKATWVRLMAVNILSFDVLFGDEKFAATSIFVDRCWSDAIKKQKRKNGIKRGGIFVGDTRNILVLKRGTWYSVVIQRSSRFSFS